ncbi:R-spondin-3-like isoform X3 [Ptychodera flava]|uniref:R-spondin-3-like isoform X3 n=1 Tax=Ptychodera flava TaxID=63121 RepID=UPI00396A5C13
METFRTILILLVIWFCEITPSGCRYRSTGTSRAQVTTGVSPLLFDQECRHGCKTCSTYNGCVTCRPRLFLLLHRSDMKHIGICTHECPVGYYGHRAPEMNMCYKCKVDNCAKCFGRTFCTRCQSPYYLSEGDCVETCPDDMYPDEKTSECKRTDHLNSSEPKPAEERGKNNKEKNTERGNRDKRRRKKNKSRRRKRVREERKRRRKNNRRSQKKREKMQKQTLTA